MVKLLLSPNEVAEVLGLGRPKIYALLARGELPSLRVGRSVRVPIAGLRRWIEGHSSDASDQPPEPE